MPNEKLKSLSLYDEILFDLLDIVLSLIELLIGPLKSVHNWHCILLFLTSPKSSFCPRTYVVLTKIDLESQV